MIGAARRCKRGKKFGSAGCIRQGIEAGKGIAVRRPAPASPLPLPLPGQPAPPGRTVRRRWRPWPAAGRAGSETAIWSGAQGHAVDPEELIAAPDRQVRGDRVLGGERQTRRRRPHDRSLRRS